MLRTCTTGGRVTGADSIAEMIRELHLSVDAGKGFEGEMARLSSYSRCRLHLLCTRRKLCELQMAFRQLRRGLRRARCSQDGCRGACGIRWLAAILHVQRVGEDTGDGGGGGRRRARGVAAEGEPHRWELASCFAQQACCNTLHSPSITGRHLILHLMLQIVGACIV